MLLQIAVTGGLSSGKSSVCRFLGDLGAHVVSADQIVHSLLKSPKTKIGKQVVDLLGLDIVIGDEISRQAVSNVVFANPALLSELEAILHPAVREEVKRQFSILSAKEQSDDVDVKKLFVVEIPLLFEVEKEGGEKRGDHFDYTVAVIASESACQERFMTKMGLTLEDFRNRTARQLPPEVKKMRADYTIENNGNLNDLRLAVEKLYRTLYS